MEEKQLTYLYSSIGDIQNTIRAIDTKLGLLMVFILREMRIELSGNDRFIKKLMGGVEHG